uniref:Protein FAM33A n=1 Tax=Meleagris gallopavo TaxID=9103 RepID=A0A803XQF0_MELGA
MQVAEVGLWVLFFQKAESDLDYIQHRLEFEIMKSLPDNPAAEPYHICHHN